MKDSGAAPALVLAVHSCWGGHCQGMGNSGVAGLIDVDPEKRLFKKQTNKQTRHDIPTSTLSREVGC